jgi:hypothetical protein
MNILYTIVNGTMWIFFEFPEEIQVMTNVVITPNQTQSLCPENPYTDPYFNSNLCDKK